MFVEDFALYQVLIGLTVLAAVFALAYSIVFAAKTGSIRRAELFVGRTTDGYVQLTLLEVLSGNRSVYLVVPSWREDLLDNLIVRYWIFLPYYLKVEQNVIALSRVTYPADESRLTHKRNIFRRVSNLVIVGQNEAVPA